MHGTLAVITVWIHACQLQFATALDVPPHIKIMTAVGYSPSNQTGWSSFGKSFRLSSLVEGHRDYGLPGVYRLDCVGCEGLAAKEPGYANGIVCCTHSDCTGSPRYSMCNKTAGHHTDWDTQTRALLSLARPHFVSGALLGVMLGDELTLSGVPFSAFERWVNLVKETLDAITRPAGQAPLIIYYMSSSYVCTWPHIPYNLTHLSACDYFPEWMYPSSPGKEDGLWVLPIYKRCILPRLAPHQRLLVVPPAYGMRGNCTGAPSVWCTNQTYAQWVSLNMGNLSFYTSWAFNETRIEGFDPWPLAAGHASTTSAFTDLGLLEMPEIYAAYKSLGEAIVGQRSATQRQTHEGAQPAAVVSAAAAAPKTRDRTAAPSHTFSSASGEITAKVYLPGEDGFYQGTRFEQPMVHSLVLNAGAESISSSGGDSLPHEFYGPWFNSTRPCSEMSQPDCCSCDYEFNGPEEIIAGPLSAATGPVDCFGAVGWEQARPGNGTFIKIGVGALLRPANSVGVSHSDMFLYNITNRGQWRTRKGNSYVEFEQDLDDSHSSGYSFVYTKRVSLEGHTMRIFRSIKNTGRLAISSETFTHNFLTLDQQPPLKGTTVSVPWLIQPDPSQPPLNDSLAAIDPSGKSIVYQTTLQGDESFYFTIASNPKPAKDNRIEINSTALGAGMRIVGSYEMPKLGLWSIRTVIAAEPFVNVSVAPQVRMQQQARSPCLASLTTT